MPFLYYVILSLDASMVAGGYFPTTHCVAQLTRNESEDLGAMTDNDFRSCVRNSVVVDGTDLSLQGTFRFHGYSNEDNTLTIKIVVEGVMECTSLLWTWFVQSNETTGSFRECSKSLMLKDSNVTHCSVTCACATPCISLHLKYNSAVFMMQERRMLCEVLLQPGDIAPGLA